MGFLICRGLPLSIVRMVTRLIRAGHARRVHRKQEQERINADRQLQRAAMMVSGAQQSLTISQSTVHVRHVPSPRPLSITSFLIRVIRNCSGVDLTGSRFAARVIIVRQQHMTAALDDYRHRGAFII